MSFSVNVKKFIKDTNADVDIVTKKVIIDLSSAIIKDTPVDTGRARGNWQFSTGSPIAETENTQGSTALAGIANKANSAKFDKPVYIGNNLPYIGLLEFVPGYSQKSPAGFVRRNVQRFQRLVDTIAKGTR